jgi:hypothetical protein
VQSCKPGPYISDHCVVKTILNIKKESVISKTTTFRNFKEIDQLQFSNDLKSISIENDVNINDFVDQFECEIQRVLDRHAPLKEKTKICRPPKPWFSESILRLKRQTRKLESLGRRYRTKEHFEALKTSRNKYTYAINQEKKAVITNKVLSAKGD